MSDSGTIDMDMELGNQTDSHRILQRYRPLEWIRKSGWWFPLIEHPLTTMEEKCQSVFQLGTCTKVCVPAHVHEQVKVHAYHMNEGATCCFIGLATRIIPYRTHNCYNTLQHNTQSCQYSKQSCLSVSVSLILMNYTYREANLLNGFRNNKEQRNCWNTKHDMIQ